MQWRRAFPAVGGLALREFVVVLGGLLRGLGLLVLAVNGEPGGGDCADEAYCCESH